MTAVGLAGSTLAHPIDYLPQRYVDRAENRRTRHLVGLAHIEHDEVLTRLKPPTQLIDLDLLHVRTPPFR